MQNIMNTGKYNLNKKGAKILSIVAPFCFCVEKDVGGLACLSNNIYFNKRSLPVLVPKPVTIR